MRQYLNEKEVFMANKKKDDHDLANWTMAVCAIIVVIIELARFILDYIIR
jgi:hypothetical protein